MLSLDSPQWSELCHAYGRAGDIPSVLHQLAALPSDANDAEPWFSLWSALAHQGDVFQASFAAVPYVVHALGSSPTTAPEVFLQFPAWVEVCRLNKRLEVEPALAEAYFQSLRELPMLAALALGRENCSADMLRCALAATAAAKGQPEVAEAALELTPEVAIGFLQWHFTS